MPKVKTTKDIWHGKGVWELTVIRALAALSILAFPVWGFIASLIFDILDARYLLPYGHLDKLAYDLWDKILDSATFVTELMIGLTTPWAGLMIGLFLYRMVGHIIFWIIKKPRILIFFPNVFESTFFWILIPVHWWYAFHITAMTGLYWLYAIKITHEIVLHGLWPVYVARPWKKFIRRIFGGSTALVNLFSTTYPEGYT